MKNYSTFLENCLVYRGSRHQEVDGLNLMSGNLSGARCAESVNLF
jgi:hypothetical protein